MPQFQTRRFVPYTARQMFDLVADVESYPQFLPLCEGLTVRSRRPIPEGEEVVATMRVGYKAIQESFTSRVTLVPAQLTVRAAYLDGPFSRLENRWSFVDRTGGGCDVEFFISYEFKSVMLGMLMGGLFDTAFRKFTTAFENRARKIYGPPQRPVIMPSS